MRGMEKKDFNAERGEGKREGEEKKEQDDPVACSDLFRNVGEKS
jgi:hypothetical protein